MLAVYICRIGMMEMESLLILNRCGYTVISASGSVCAFTKGHHSILNNIHPKQYCSIIETISFETKRS